MSPNMISVSSLMLFFLLSTAVVDTASVEGKDDCSPSSCGPVQSIRYPFRLKDDPAQCGDPNFQVTCNSNNKAAAAVLEISSSKYLLTDISYENVTIRVVGVGFATGSCSSSSLSPSAIYPQSGYYTVVDQAVATFLNCSEKIDRNDKYRPIPCLSQNSSFFVYVTSGASVGDVAPFCSFSSMVPTPYDITSREVVDVFQALQEGFSLNWTPIRMTTSAFIRGCLKEATKDHPWEERKRKSMITWFIYPFQIEKDFLDCMNPKFYDSSSPYVPSSVIYRFMFAFIISIDIAALLTVIALLGRFILAPLSIYAFLAYNLWKMLKPVDTVEKFLQKHQTLAPTRYAYTDIVAITGHFKEKLGQGGFGAVFKGQLPGGFLVAIKILSKSKCDGEDFISEVSTIGTIHHLNVVGLVGFCSEGAKRALVYEFMPNGSLDKYIFPSGGGTNRRRRLFTKEKLNEIALGVGRGIDYLHRGCDMRILHFDIKPHNILLDQNFEPKVSDFGLAKLYPKDYSVVSACAARGTIGYMAPELVSRTFGLISYKSDVYSFGMLLMEMAGGRRNVDLKAENSSQAYYPSWIYDQLEQRGRLEIGEANAIEIDHIETKLSKVGLWCIQMRSSDRPSMSEVVEMLEADGDALPMPPKPFSSGSRTITLRQPCIASSTTELPIISEKSDTISLHSE